MTDNLTEPLGLGRDNLVFLDFEASGLEPGSWPIEIGLAQIRDEDGVSINSCLICPHKTWPESLWSPASAQVHGISRAELNGAFSAEVIAADFLELLIGKVIVSDAPEFDQRWLDMLAELLEPMPHFVVRDFDWVIAPFGFAGVKRAYETLDALPSRHRAGDDAARLAQAWLAAASAPR